MKLLSVLFPAVCPFCGAVISEKEYKDYGFCYKCITGLDKFTELISEENNPNFPSCDRVYSAFKYYGVVKRTLIAYKFNECPYLHKSFSVYMNRFLKKYNIFENVDIVTFVPISSKRFAGRGYNQAALIAQELVRLNNCYNKLKYLLDRKKNSDIRTSSLNLEQRKIDKFSFVDNKACLNGQRILLIDDILTTGATIEECSKILKSHGASHVIAAVIASGRRDF